MCIFLEIFLEWQKNGSFCLTQWGRVTHICVSNLTIIGSNNGLLSGRRQAIIWTNAVLLLIGPLGTNFSKILFEIQTFSFKKIHLKISSAKWGLFRLSLNVLRVQLWIPFIFAQPCLQLVQWWDSVRQMSCSFYINGSCACLRLPFIKSPTRQHSHNTPVVEVINGIVPIHKTSTSSA